MSDHISARVLLLLLLQLQKRGKGGEKWEYRTSIGEEGSGERREEREVRREGRRNHDTKIRRGRRENTNKDWMGESRRQMDPYTAEPLK